MVLISVFLYIVRFPYSKRIDFRTCRVRFSSLRRTAAGLLEVGVWNRFIGFWVNAVGFSTALFLYFHQPRILQLPQGIHRLLPPTVEQGDHLADGVIQVNPPIFVRHPFFRDNSARRRIKAYSTFASLDRGLNDGASKRKLGSRVKLMTFSGW